MHSGSFYLKEQGDSDSECVWELQYFVLYKFVINFLEYLHIYRKWVFAYSCLVCLFVTLSIAEPKCHIILNYTLSSNTTDFLWMSFFCARILSRRLHAI